MTRKDLVKQTLLSLLQEAEPAVTDDALFLGKMKIHCTESGYANVQLSRPLDIERGMSLLPWREQTSPHRFRRSL